MIARAPTVTAPASTGTRVAPPTDAVTTPQAATERPEDAPGGAGDEEAIRIPVSLSVRAGAVKPSTVSVPAFLTLEITVRSTDGAAHAVAVGGTKLAAPASGTPEALQVQGRKPGTYPVTVDGAQVGTLVVGDEPGP